MIGHSGTAPNAARAVATAPHPKSSGNSASNTTSAKPNAKTNAAAGAGVSDSEWWAAIRPELFTAEERRLAERQPGFEQRVAAIRRAEKCPRRDAIDFATADTLERVRPIDIGKVSLALRVTEPTEEQEAIVLAALFRERQLGGAISEAEALNRLAAKVARI